MKIDTEILCGFIDGELDAATAAAVRAALDTDENLRQEYEDLRKTAELVRGLPKVSAPPELLQGITANAEREQLLGSASPTPARRAGLYWGLSVAASLLIGVGLGVLGYHELRNEPEPGDGHIPVMLVKHEPDEELMREKTDLSVTVDERIASVSKTGREPTEVYGKGGMRIPRSGPESRLPAKSSRGAGENEAALKGNLAGSAMTKETVRAEQYQQELRYADKDAQAQDVEMRVAAQANQSIPLEPQVRANNFVNQNMAVNLDFEAEPLNVKVVSNDTAKTLQYVQQWAASNSLIDLNKASPEVNFPVYTQVVYQGQPGANIAPTNENGILVRTTRGQARQIVTELQNQRPLVVSVAVTDKKNTLGLDGEKLEEEGPGPASGVQFGAVQRQEGLAEQQVAQAAGTETPDQLNLASQSRQIASVPLVPATEPETARYYFSQITNQMQIYSLEDLVTLVVMVTDARSSQTTTPAAKSEASQSK